MVMAHFQAGIWSQAGGLLQSDTHTHSSSPLLPSITLARFRLQLATSVLVDAEELDVPLLLLLVVEEPEPEDAEMTVVVEHVPEVSLESLSSTYHITTIIMSLVPYDDPIGATKYQRTSTVCSVDALRQVSDPQPRNTMEPTFCAQIMK